MIATDEPLRLPAPPAAPAPAPFPFLSALAPVVGAAVLWTVTGSVFALWFAALGPVLAVASMLDGRRSSRRSRRRAERETQSALADIRRELDLRHGAEREARWMRHPDVLTHVARPQETWRRVDGRADVLVVGSGEAASGVRVEGGDDGDAARELRARSRRVDHAPVIVPLRDGVALVGPPHLCAAVARGLVLQVCSNLPPGDVHVGDLAESWADALPHRSHRAPMTMAVTGSRDPGDPGVDIPIILVPDGMPPPSRCAAVLTLRGPVTARLEIGTTVTTVEVEPVSRAQAAGIAAALADRASKTLRGTVGPDVALTDLLGAAPVSRPDALPAVLGTRAGAPVAVDLVSDGPHAVVIGVTGSGKSELLTTWVAALAATHSPSEVAFFLVDFKGGAAFEPLTVLPHVTGVLTDLDETAALRAIDSLRAELRHRERVLAEAGVRDVADAGGALPRLVIVVDEYAALVASHPALHDLFGDIAARGRALGMHLLLASQRAAGVFRDAVLANAPLRLALRVTDSADSRAVLGDDSAARLPGRPEDRGICLVRGPSDAAPRELRVARCPAAALPGFAAVSGAPARRPWLAPLASRIDRRGAAGAEGDLLVGMADEPELQRQRPWVLGGREPGILVAGAAGTGRSTVLRTLADQAEQVVQIPADAEPGWDAIAEAVQARPGTLIVADDLDLLLSRLGHDHGALARDRLEELARSARARGIRLAVSVQRPTAAVARVVDALPRRFLLSHTTRTDYVAAGGDPSHHAALPPGRGRLDGVLVQAYWTEPVATRPSETPVWQPGRHPVAVVAPGVPRTHAVLESWARAGVDVVGVDTPGAVPAAGRVLCGTPEAWLGQWRLLNEVRASCQLVIDADCAAEYRALTASPELPPYALPHAARAWLRTPAGTVRRIRLTDAR